MISGPLDSYLQEKIDALPPDLREAALKDFEELRRSRPISGPGLLNVLENKAAKAELRAISAWCIGLLDDQSFAGSLLNALVESQEDLVIWEVTKALCSLGTGGREFLALVENAPSETHRLASAYALGLLGDPSTVPDLVRILSCIEEPAELRARIAETLGYIGERSAVPALMAATDDSASEVRFWAVFALGNLGDQRAIPTLERLAATDHELVEGWWKVSEEALSALAEVKTQGEPDPV